jgi:hypothetical protein
LIWRDSKNGFIAAMNPVLNPSRLNLPKPPVSCASPVPLAVEIILPSDRGGSADRFGLPLNGEKMKIVVIPGD